MTEFRLFQISLQKSVQQPTIIRMNPATAAASIVTTSTTPAGLSIGSGNGVGLPQAAISVKRRRLSASSDDSGASDDALSMSPGTHTSGQMLKGDQTKGLTRKSGYSSVLNRTSGPNNLHSLGLWKKHTPNSTHGSGLWFKHNPNTYVVPKMALAYGSDKTQHNPNT